MAKWLVPALDYLPRWLEHQLRVTMQPGCAISVAHKGKTVLDVTLGIADESTGTALTPAHRFRVASHSKTFTAAGVLRLWDDGRLQLDDPVGRHVADLHPQIATTTLAQLMSHSAGVIRDGEDAGQWAERRPFLDATRLRDALKLAPTLEANTRFKYSNHGYGLLGLAIESIVKEPYGDWIAREVVGASGLANTSPDVPVADGATLARGHGSRLPLGRRVVVPADMSTNALASATGFVSTAGDLACFFASLAPDAKHSILSVAARREMTRRHRQVPQSGPERWYGLGVFCGMLDDWEWFGHSGSFPGTLSRTVTLPEPQLTISIITNAADGPAQAWMDGAVSILRACERHGPPKRDTAAWAGRWWTLWGAVDLLPLGDRVLVANPALASPLTDASRIAPEGERKGRLQGRIVDAPGLGSHGEAVQLELDTRGKAVAFWLGGTRLLTEKAVAKELELRYSQAQGFE